MPSLLFVPVFALFGALLVSEAGDVRQRKLHSTYWRRATSQGGTVLGNVWVDERVYDALRAAARLRKKSREAVALAEDLVASAGADEANWRARVAARKLLAKLQEKDALLDELEASCRELALGGRTLDGSPIRLPPR